MIDYKNVKNVLSSAGILLKETGIDAIEEIIHEECKKSMYDQMCNDIVIAIMAFSDIGVKEDDLYDLLYNFWGIDSRSEAKQFILKGRYVEWPYHRLKLYLKNNGYTAIEIIKFMNENDVRKKLKNDPNLSKLEVDKLKITIENQ